MEDKRAGPQILADKSFRKPGALHPSWAAFIDYCSRLQHGEIERLTIQNGLPVLAEETRKKVKFTN